jgi:hypothetical protein
VVKYFEAAAQNYVIKNAMEMIDRLLFLGLFAAAFFVILEGCFT